MTDTIDQLEAGEDTIIENEALRNEVIVTLDGRDISTPMAALDVDIDSTPAQVLTAVAGIIAEAEGEGAEGYQDAYGDFTYTVRKAMNSNTIFVYPKPVAGDGIEININDRVKVVGRNKQIIISELVDYLRTEGFLVLDNQMV